MPWSRLVVPAVLALAACEAEPYAEPEPEDTAPPSVEVLAGLWVGTGVNALTHIDHRDDVDAEGDCEDGTEESCDSVLELDADGSPSDATPAQVQFAATAIADLYRATGTEIGATDYAFAILGANEASLALIQWAPRGADTYLSVGLKDKYEEDPFLPGVKYDATRLDGHTFTGRTYTFTADGSANAPLEGQTVTVAATAAGALSFTGDSTLNGVPVTDAPTLRYDDAALDGWLGIYHTGRNLDASSDDLVAGEETYRTVIAIPGREAASLLLVTCEGEVAQCSDGAGTGTDSWDITRYSFSVLTR